MRDGDKIAASRGTAQPADRRAYARMRLELRCYEAGKISEAMVGRTLNVSRNGALLLWNSPAGLRVPAPGDPLDVDLELPPGACTVRCIRCRGQVVRVLRKEDQPPRVAVAIAQMTFASRSRPLRKRRLPGNSARLKQPVGQSSAYARTLAIGPGVALPWIA